MERIEVDEVVDIGKGQITKGILSESVVIKSPNKVLGATQRFYVGKWVDQI